MIRHLLALGCCALLGACSALTGPRSEYVVFTLNPAPASETVSSETASTEPTEADWVLAIDEPHALGLLDTDRLVVAPDANERLAFAGVRWNERTPVLLQEVWLRAFEGDGRLAGIVRHPGAMRTDRVLASDLVAFQIEHAGGQPEAVVSLRARLSSSGDRVAIAQRSFSARVAVSDSSARAAIAALESATAEVTGELVDWTLREGQAALERHDEQRQR